MIDHLLKPITYNRFLKSIEKFGEWKRGAGKSQYVYIKESSIQYKVSLDDILYIEGSRDYIKIYTPGRCYMSLLGLKNILQQMLDKRFVRIHRSYIDKIKTILPCKVKIGAVSIPIGETYKKPFLKTFDR